VSLIESPNKAERQARESVPLLRRIDANYWNRYQNVTLATRLDVFAFARHTYEYTPDTIVHVEIKRSQDLLKEQRTLFLNYQFKL